MNNFFEWILSNKDWLFSGAGLVILISSITIISRYLNHRKNKKNNIVQRSRENLKVIVFDFDNFGEELKRENIGEYFSEIVLDRLLSYGAKFEYNDKHKPEVIMIADRPPGGTFINYHFGNEFRELKPFIYITGYALSNRWDRSGIFLHVRVGYVDNNLTSKFLFAEQVKIKSIDNKIIKKEADHISKKIFSKLIDFDINKQNGF